MRPTKPKRKSNIIKKKRRPGHSRGYDLYTMTESCKILKNGGNQTKTWKLLSRDSLEVYKERRRRNTMQNGRPTAKNRGMVGPSYGGGGGGSRAKSKKKITKRVERPRKRKKKPNNDSETTMTSEMHSMSRSSYSDADSNKSED